MKLRIGTLVLAAAMACHAWPASAGFADPLHTPAVMSPLAARGLFNAVTLAGSRVVAVGQRGHVLYSDDGGATWNQASVPLSSDLASVRFATPKDGWAVGHDGVVLVTHDAGASWTSQLDGRRLGSLLLGVYTADAPADLDAEARARWSAEAQRFADEGPDKPFLDVWFEDARHGWIVGAFGLLLRTEDGGRSWQPWMHRADNPKALHLYAIRAIGTHLYVAGEQGLLLRLDRDRQHFEALDLPYEGTLFGVVGDARGLVAFGLRGNALRSTDGGSTWTTLDTGLSVTLTAGAPSPDGALVLASQTGQLLVSRDAGATVAPLALPRRVPASAVLPMRDGSLIIAGPRGLHRIVPAGTQE